MSASSHHGLADDLLHVAIALLVQVLHQVHDAARGVGALGVALGSLGRQVHPLVVAELALHLNSHRECIQPASLYVVESFT